MWCIVRLWYGMFVHYIKIVHSTFSAVNANIHFVRSIYEACTVTVLMHCASHRRYMKSFNRSFVWNWLKICFGAASCPFTLAFYSVNFVFIENRNFLLFCSSDPPRVCMLFKQRSNAILTWACSCSCCFCCCFSFCWNLNWMHLHHVRKKLQFLSSYSHCSVGCMCMCAFRRFPNRFDRFRQPEPLSAAFETRVTRFQCTCTHMFYCEQHVR